MSDLNIDEIVRVAKENPVIRELIQSKLEELDRAEFTVFDPQDK